jgi:Rps23 Pro-64 3,4-dihydroxylase Tpa1-like proline 4-hydroxylase
LAHPSAALKSGSQERPLLELIRSEVRSQVAALSERFLKAQPFRYLVVDDFVELEYCRQLIAEFPAFDRKQALNEFGQAGGKAVFQNLPQIGPAYERFDRLLRSREFLSLVSEITGIPDLLYDPDYIGGGTHENLSGQELDPHVDFNFHPKTKLHRRLNLILFLNPEWREEWGGSLELHLNPWLPPAENRVQTVAPVANRCVLFETSEHSWHGFSRIAIPEGSGLSRRSIAVYFYTRDRPVEETAPDHSTVYVQRPLPGHITAGYTLREQDIGSIRNLLERRDQQIKFLYEREKEREKRHSDQLDQILQSPAFRLGRMLTWPLRRIRDAVRGR